MLNVAGEMFIEYEKKLDESIEIIKCYEICVGDDKSKNDVLSIVFENKIKKFKFRKTWELQNHFNQQLY